MKCPGVTEWFQVDSGTNQFKAGKYVVGIGIYRVRATDRHCRKRQRNNEFGTKKYEFVNNYWRKKNRRGKFLSGV